MTEGIDVHPADRREAEAAFEVFTEVADEWRWIGTEPGFDREARLDWHRTAVDDPTVALLVAVAADQPARHGVVGDLGLTLTSFGVAELGMVVDLRWRGQGVGDALVAAAVPAARALGAHKIALQVWPHNVAARALYVQHGFVEEGVLRRHYRRKDGSLWDAICMGLVLDETSPGGPPVPS